MLALHQSLWQRANAWNSFETLNRGQFTLSAPLIILNYTVYNLTNLKVLMEWPRSQQLKNQAVMALKTENILKIHKQISQIGKNARSVNWVLYIEYILVLMYQIYQCYVTIIVKQRTNWKSLKLWCFTRKAVTAYK